MPETPADESGTALLPLLGTLFTEWWQGMRGFLQEHQDAVVLIATISGVVLVASALVLPFIVVKMREDYFLPDRDLDKSFALRHPVLRWTGLILKNTLGAVLLVSGVAMLVLPGQGILTILMGIMLSDLPGKRRLELWLVRRPPVLKALNWIRSKGHKPPFELPKPARS